ncbi:MAG: hypothetical protein NT061_05950 [Spirochaetes bacterium]|nr:hypothetical protein [Spirochaetota bacterium]
MQSRSEFLAAKSGWSAFTTILPLSEKPVQAPNTSDFKVAKPHPYIEMIDSGNVLYFCGTVRVEASKGRYIDLFILKRVDETLRSQLSFNNKIRRFRLSCGKGLKIQAT